MLVGDGEDQDDVAFDDVQQLVGKAAEDEAADRGLLDRCGKRPVSKSTERAMDLDPESRAETRHLSLVIARPRRIRGVPRR